jgi:hypothetical protein
MAGHGPVTSGRPVRGHAQSRRCRSGHGHHGVGPEARAPTARHVAHGSLACAIGGRSLCWALLASSARRCPASAALLPTRPCSDPEIASSIQKSSGPKGHTFLLLGSSCHAATGVRLVPWRQPGGWGMRSLIASTAPFRPEPDVYTWISWHILSHTIPDHLQPSLY